MITGFFLAVILTAIAEGQGPSFTVYVFTQTDASGFTDTNQELRLNAVTRLKQELSKKKTVRLAEERNGSDIEVEILGSGKKDTGNLITRPDFYGTRTTKEERGTVHIAMRAGEYPQEMEAVERTSSLNAKALAHAIDEWVKQNRDVLARRRNGGAK